MKNLKTKLSYTLYFVLAVVFLTSCGFMEDERAYNKKSWEIKTKTIELEYLEKLYRIKSDIELEQRLVKIDSLILNYR